MRPARTIPTIVPVAAVLAAGLMLTGCSTPAADVRNSALENRQDRMDARAEARAERRQIRSNHMDARTEMIFN